jgi:PAS domain S-box-containing protein
MKRAKPTRQPHPGRPATIDGLRSENRLLRAEVKLTKQKLAASESHVGHDATPTADLRDYEQIYRQMFTNQSAVRLLIEPATGAIADANPAACEFYGYDRATLLTMKISDINTLPMEQISAHMRMGFRGRGFFRFRHRLASGELRDVDVYTSPIAIGGCSFLNSIIHDVTETVRVEVALKRLNEELEQRVHERTLQLSRSEETFEKAFRATPIALCLVNLTTHTLLDANDGFLRITGFTKVEVLGRSFASLNVWVDDGDRARLLASMSGNGSTHEFETKFRMKDGDIRDFVVNGETVTINGTACYLFAGRDVTALKISREYDHRKEQQLKNIVDLLQVKTDSVQYILDLILEEAIHLSGSAIGCICQFDERTQALRLSGYSEKATDRAIQPSQSVHTLDDAGVWSEAIRRRKPVLINDIAASNPLANPSCAADVQIRRFLAVPHFVNGRIVAMLGVANKKTDYEQFDSVQLQLLIGSLWGKVESVNAEQALRTQATLLAKREEQYRLLFENMTTGFALHEMIYDEAGRPFDYRYLEINPAFEKLTGISARELVGKTLRETNPGSDLTWISIFGNVAKNGVPIHYHKYSDHLGKYFDTLAYCPRKDQFALIISDISEEQQSKEERERLLRELARKNQELLRSNRDLDDFAHIASHDLQEPLRMVSSYTQLLAKRYGTRLDDDARDFIAFAVDGAARMQELIRSLLSYSRVGRDTTPPQEVDCSTVIDDVMQNLRVAIEESGAGITRDALPTLRAHRFDLIQLFQNLIGNAVKFRGKQPPAIHVGVTHEGDIWHFTVRDNGIGIDPQYFDKIFEVFQRLHLREQHPGTGIGLAVCRKIVERLGGKIWVTSRPGQGTTFHFTLREAAQ